MWRVLLITLGAVVGPALVAHTILAQNPPMPHQDMSHHPVPSGQMPMSHAAMHDMQQGTATAGAPSMPGQDAFGAIAEIVQMLEVDPATDWTKVDLERLRQHLINMNDVVLRSQVKQSSVPGGLAMEVTGRDSTEQAIRAMVVPHAAELDRMPEYAAKTQLIPGGVRLTVTAKAPDDAKVVTRLRGLGFIGLLTVGAHHGPHHLAMAKGEAFAHSH